MIMKYLDVFRAGIPRIGQWVVGWQTLRMPAPAFWYYDTEEQAKAAAAKFSSLYHAPIQGQESCCKGGALCGRYYGTEAVMVTHGARSCLPPMSHAHGHDIRPCMIGFGKAVLP